MLCKGNPVGSGRITEDCLRGENTRYRIGICTRSVRLEAANAKKSFDQLKTEYEEESKSKKGDLESQRAKAKEIMASVDPALLEEYETIKKHISPPVARLTHGQCAGCNTSLPSAILSKIKSGALVECETCGRMIIP